MKTNAGFCDGVSRRDVLRVGTVGMLGTTLNQLLGYPVIAQDEGLYARPKQFSQRARSCVLIWLGGGASHVDTFDLKPEAPAEYRGEFKPISTSLPDLQICEHLPKTAKVMDRVSLVRSVTGPEGEHGRASHHLLTGHRLLPVATYPSYGSVVYYKRGFGPRLPNYISVPRAGRYMGSGFLPRAYDPFEVGGDPSAGTYRVRDIYTTPGFGLTIDRIAHRRELVAQIDKMARAVARTGLTEARASFFEQAYDLLTSHQARDSFDLTKEEPSTRQRYGMTSIGQGCLLARRLVEAGVAFVSVTHSGGAQPVSWDTHVQNFPTLKDQLLPQLDAAYATLIEDLDQRGLLDTTLVVLMGEFGRTPKINQNAGRDHWPRAHSVCLAGGGIRRGQVLGRTDEHADSPAERPVSPGDLAATMYTLLGIDPHQQEHSSDGRSVRLVAEGNAVKELMS